MLNDIARQRMNALTSWLTANKGQQHWSIAETSKDFHRRVDGYNTPRGMVLVVTTQIGDNVTWSVFGEAGAGLPHAERLEALDGILAAIPGVPPPDPAPAPAAEVPRAAVEASHESVPDHSSCIPFSTPVAAPKAKGVLF